jgi:hypothetical protein
MRTKKTPFLILTLFCYFLSGCEKDDICLVETPSTPKLIVHLFDKDDRTTRKAADEIIIYGVGQEKALLNLETDSLAIPLKTQEAFTRYAFLLPTSTASVTVGDTIQFNYRRYDEYIDRACGYRANYILDNDAISFPNTAPVWMDSFEILIDTISNEQQTHLAIYH